LCLQSTARIRLDSLVPAAIGLGSFLVYLRTLAPSVLPADSGEFQFAVPLLAVPHPTGYPLYMILGKVFVTLVPFGDPAFRLNLLSAVLSALAVAAVYLAGMRLTGRRGPAAISSLALAVSPIFWSQAIRAEVYSLNSLFVAAILVLALTGGAIEDRRGAGAGAAAPSPWLYAMALLYGLSLTHHRTMILLAPALGIYLWLGRRQLGRWSPRSLGLLAGAFLLPLLLYAYIPLRAGATPFFRLTLAPGRELVLYDNSLAAFLREISGSDFGSQISMAGWDARLGAVVRSLLAQFGGAAMALGVTGAAASLIAGLRRRGHLPDAPGAGPAGLRTWLLLGLVFAAVAGFGAIYRIGDVTDLLTPAVIVLALWIGLGVNALLDAGTAILDRVDGSRPAGAGAEQRTEGHLSAAWRTLAVAACGLLPLILLAQNAAGTDLSRDTTRQQWEQVLAQPIPARAALLTNDRDEMMPLWYLQHVEGRRTDLLGLFPLIAPGRGYSNIVRLLDTASETGRDLYLIKPMPGLEVRYVTQQDGALYRVIGPVVLAAPQRPVAADLAGQVRLLGADVGSLIPCPCSAMAGVPKGPDLLPIILHWEGTGAAHADYQVFVHLVDSNGNTVSQSDHRTGGDFYPTSLWENGELLRDEHRLPVPPPGVYELRAGMYLGSERLKIAGGGDSVSLGSVTF
jgi:hypothetical protein